MSARAKVRSDDCNRVSFPRRFPFALVSPSARTKNASLIIGRRTRLTTNPGPLFTVIDDFPSFCANASTASCVASLV